MKMCCYNDDIQGTAGVTLAGVINALKLTGGQLKDQRLLFLGAGAAAIGLATLMVSALGQQGIAAEVARLCTATLMRPSCAASRRWCISRRLGLRSVCGCGGRVSRPGPV